MNYEINIEQAINNLYQDPSHADPYPIFNILKEASMNAFKVYLPINGMYEDHYNLEVINASNGTYNLQIFTHFIQQDFVIEELEDVLFEFLLDPHCNEIIINNDTKPIYLTKEMIVKILMHLPLSNLTFIKGDDIIADYYAKETIGDQEDILDELKKIMMEAKVNNSRTLMIPVKISSIHEILTSFIEILYKEDYPIVDVYLSVDEDVDGWNETWNAMFDYYDPYDNKDIYEGGRLFYEGRYEEAVECYLRAANQHNTSAYTNLGYCYKMGKGVPQDMDIAMNYFKEANKYFDVSSFLMIGDHLLKDNMEGSYDLYKYAYTLASYEKDKWSYPDSILKVIKYNVIPLTYQEKYNLLDTAIDYFKQRQYNNDSYTQELIDEAEALKSKMIA